MVGRSAWWKAASAGASENRRTTLISQVVSSVRAALFTVVAANLLDADDFGRLAIVVLVSILANSVLRAAVTNPIAVRSHDVPDTLVPAVQAQFLLALASSLIAFVVLMALGVDRAISVGLLVIPLIAAADAVRVASVHLNHARRAIVVDVVWFVVLFAGIAVARWIVDLTAAHLLAIWAIAALTALLVVLPESVAFDRSRLQTFVDEHQRVGRQMALELVWETIPVRVVPVVGLPILALNAVGGFRAAETTLGVTLIAWASTTLSTLGEASSTASRDGLAGALSVVTRRVAPVLAILIVNAAGVIVVGRVLGEFVFDDVWSTARELLVPTTTLFAAQVALSIPTITARASNLQSEANRAAFTAALMAVPLSAASGWLWGVRGLLYGDAAGIAMAGAIATIRLVRRRGSD